MDWVLFFIAILFGFFVASIAFFIYYKYAINKEGISIIKNAKKVSEQLKQDKILQAKEKFLELKVDHENVIIFSLQRIDLDDHAYLKPLADKLEMSVDLKMLNRWYAPSIDFFPIFPDF